MPRLPARAALAASVSTLVALPMAGIAQAAPTPPAKPVTVMTRNLYLGADINRPVEAALAAQDAGATGPQIVPVLAVATHATRAIVDATDFPTRSRLLAARSPRTGPTSSASRRLRSGARARSSWTRWGCPTPTNRRVRLPRDPARRPRRGRDAVRGGRRRRAGGRRVPSFTRQAATPGTSG